MSPLQPLAFAIANCCMRPISSVSWYCKRSFQARLIPPPPMVKPELPAFTEAVRQLPTPLCLGNVRL